MTEQWIQGHVLQRIMFRDGLVLNLDEYNELVISVPMDLTLPEIPGAAAGESLVVRIDPTAVRAEYKPLFDFAGCTCTHADWDEDGSLHLQFSGGQHIDVPSDEAHTAWELYGKHHGYAACLPHGRVRVVRHDQPEPASD
jgi:hypothetical protein